MIVPQNRLLLWVAVVFLPGALAGTAAPALAGVSLAAAGLLVAVAALDAFRGCRAAPNLTVTLPPVVRLTQDRPGNIEVRLAGRRRQAMTVRLALGLPPEIHSQEEAAVLLAGDTEWSRLAWPCAPRRRGRFQVRCARLETPSPWGFWAARRSVAVESEIRVYPNLLADRKSLAPLFLNRGSFGLHAQRQIGKGREFEKLREYIPGDSYDEIHWKATARRGHPITKVFQIERTQEVYLLLDCSRLSGRPLYRSTAPAASRAAAGPETVLPIPLERFISATLLLALAAERQGDFFGLVTFSDKVDRFLPARNGKAHYSTCRDTLYLLEPRTVSPDFEEVSIFLRQRLRRRALLVFLTALDDPALAENFVRSVDLVRRQHVVQVNMIQPAGIQPLFTDTTIETVDDLYRHLGGHLLWHKLRELQKVLERRGVRLGLLPEDRLGAEVVAQYLNIKRRQIL
jgi:uncharacterized protein (DUF58 family)